MEQAPGPRGSPHAPQGAAARGAAAPSLPATANTESCLSRSALEQVGQTGRCPPWTSVSNAWWQLRQTYSKIGIFLLSMNPSDLAALKAAFNGLGATFQRISGFSEPIARLESDFDGVDQQDLLKAAAAHATAATALAGFVRRLVQGGTGSEGVSSFGPDRESEEQR